MSTEAGAIQILVCRDLFTRIPNFSFRATRSCNGPGSRLKGILDRRCSTDFATSNEASMASYPADATADPGRQNCDYVELLANL